MSENHQPCRRPALGRFPPGALRGFADELHRSGVRAITRILDHGGVFGQRLGDSAALLRRVGVTVKPAEKVLRAGHPFFVVVAVYDH
jgi:hypothetical protein